ncbi:MAG: TOTE conflict system archaeo-eukaryotic primase domain-containing protein [Gemmatimonadaceae bacterium]
MKIFPQDCTADAARVRARIAELDAERTELARELVQLTRRPAGPTPNGDAGPVTAASPASEKIALFRSLFAGRADVFPRRWENARTGKSGYAPACANEWKPGVCEKPRIKCGACPHQAFIALSDSVIAAHLLGTARGRDPGREFVAGVYPLLSDDTCWFLAADFDGPRWVDDARAYLAACRSRQVPAALERSRTGDGGHVWIFFTAPVPAREARQLGAMLLTEAMESRPEIPFTSYDRLFPSQDAMPAGGFGNLIALPLQRRARGRGASVFVDERLGPYADQWAYLSSVWRLTPNELTALVTDAERSGRVLRVRMPVEGDAADEPWRALPSRQLTLPAITDPVPARVHVVLADDVYIERGDLPAPLVARLVRLAAFQNPEFYRAQAMRLSTRGKPRIVSCAAFHAKHVALPRGCLDESIELLRSHGIEIDLEDRRDAGAPLATIFRGTLRPEQQHAFDAMLSHDCGVLAASTAFGKTVVAAALVARRAVNTLVLVHRRELVRQWKERLAAFLDVAPSDIGTIGAGKREPTKRVDVALIQSLVRRGEVSDLIAGYGHLVVDECHHLSAASFELVARRAKARYVLGLSATVARRDGHHPIIFMQCGPVRYRDAPKAQATRRGFAHRVVLRDTPFRLSAGEDAAGLTVPALYTLLGRDDGRNRMIVDDIRDTVAQGRAPLVLTERREHLEALRESVAGLAVQLIVLRGGLRSAARREAEQLLRETSGEPRVILATGRYLGEGFDDPRLDTLFLTMPIAWRGTLAQYVGRLHRECDGKREVVVYDYVDSYVPVLARMATRRQAGYRALGYSTA